ncbi:hypothetical protein GQF03_07875 [Sneathiella chungangensis]|uniref:Uncharacterized protein n=1 Tax=Sneathiella chungangensis TaxID=1418234 RepID=A0A845MGU9_9PROT|nr:hypothetical protein [Sneathiella chungangensis]MZR22244.1 hypothetical protein [Sneathiella chungangensis]
MATYDIEIGEAEISKICKCCGRPSSTGHGFVYKDGDSYAVYYAGWSDAHIDKVVTFALAIGEWDDHSSKDDRVCFSIEASMAREKIKLDVIEPGKSPWPDSDLLGKMLSRQNALSHPALGEILTIIGLVLKEQDTLVEFLRP